jgi:6-phosphogluconate dehydrogenase
MENFKEVTDPQNETNQSGRTNYALDTQTQDLDTTLQRKVSSKIEITITRHQLRQKFYLDQRRRKCLNSELMEAQLDCTFCDHYRNTDEWHDLLHLLWHNVNGSSSCV